MDWKAAVTRHGRKVDQRVMGCGEEGMAHKKWQSTWKDGISSVQGPQECESENPQIISQWNTASQITHNCVLSSAVTQTPLPIVPAAWHWRRLGLQRGAQLFSATKSFLRVCGWREMYVCHFLNPLVLVNRSSTSYYICEPSSII